MVIVCSAPALQLKEAFENLFLHPGQVCFSESRLTGLVKIDKDDKKDKEDQQSDLLSHHNQIGCDAVNRARARLRIEHDKIYADGTTLLPDNNRANWYDPHDRYIKSWAGFAEKVLRHFNTRVAVQTALKEMLALMHVYRADNIELRYKVPALYLRLGRDQEAYDFMVWWTSVPENYNWDDRGLLYLDTKGADALEQPDRWMRPVPENGPRQMSHAILVLLIKIRLMSGLLTQQNASYAFRGVAPNEIVDEICRCAIMDNASTSPDLTMGKPEATATAIEKLRPQIFNLFQMIHDANFYFWYAMTAVDSAKPLNPTDLATDVDRQKALKALDLVELTYTAWKQTPEAFKIVSTRYKTFNRLPYGPWPASPPLSPQMTPGAAGLSRKGPGRPIPYGTLSEG